MVNQQKDPAAPSDGAAWAHRTITVSTAIAVLGAVAAFFHHDAPRQEAARRILEETEHSGWSMTIGPDGRPRYTACHNGWCVTDRVPPERLRSREQRDGAAGGFPSVDSRAVQDALNGIKR